jgi:cystathionine beta-lyase family protein involved in aluminum resistance
MADDPKITDSSSSSAGCSSSNGSGALPQARGVVSLQDIQNVVEVMRKHTMGTCHLVVDNSGAELLDVVESGTLDGVDLVSGSLFGVLGGGIVTEGGYVAGRSSMVEKACARLSAPGLSLDAGSVPGDAHRLLFQGVFPFKILQCTTTHAVSLGFMIQIVMLCVKSLSICRADHLAMSLLFCQTQRCRCMLLHKLEIAVYYSRAQI